MIDKYNELAVSYYKEMLARGDALSRSKLLKLNMIDARELHDISDRDEWSRNFYSLIPCFEEGTLQLQNKRYIHWQITKLDLDKKMVTINIQAYEMTYINDEFVWTPGVGCNFNISNISPMDSNDIAITIQQFLTYRQIIQTAPKYMGWNEENTKIWKRVAPQVVGNLCKESEEENFCAEFVGYFLNIIQRVNLALENNKLSKGKRQKKTTAKIKYEPSDKMKEKLVRKIGDTGISITSERPPRPASEEYVRHYHVASWTRRSHTRTLKNGKQIFVRESTIKRHGFEDGEKAQTILVI